MAITIKELLASDTISQAADKINFNFDQLLLNGGGPVGPPGPLGPPGPIGGRGIRGSLWFEGPGVPAITPDLEPEDNYLEGSISTSPLGDGDVYNFNGTAWVYTGINLTGPTGPQGISADWSVFGDPLAITGDCLYPEEAPTVALPKIALNNIRSVLFGGVPNTWADPSTPVEYTIPDATAESMNSNDSALYVHIPKGDKTFGGISSIKFSGGDLPSDYTTSVSEMANITLRDDDLLTLEDVKDSVSSNYGLMFSSLNRSELHEIGRSFKVLTGTHNSGPPGAAPLNGDITLEISGEPNSGSGGNSEIALIKNSLAQNSAEFYVATTKDSAYPHTSSTTDGNIWSYANEQWMYSRTQTVIANSGGGSRLLLNNSGATLAAANQDVTVMTTGSGGIDIVSGTGDISLTGGGRLFSQMSTDIDLRCDDDIILRADDNVTITSGVAGPGNNVLLIHGVGSVGNPDLINLKASGNVLVDGSAGPATVGAQMNVSGNMNIGNNMSNVPDANGLYVSGPISIRYTGSMAQYVFRADSTNINQQRAVYAVMNDVTGTLTNVSTNAADFHNLSASSEDTGGGVYAAKRGIYVNVNDSLLTAQTWGNRVGAYINVTSNNRGAGYATTGDAIGIDLHMSTLTYSNRSDQYGIKIDMGNLSLTNNEVWGIYQTKGVQSNGRNLFEFNTQIGFSGFIPDGDGSMLEGACSFFSDAGDVDSSNGINIASYGLPAAPTNATNVWIAPQVGNGWWNSMANAGDAGIFWSDDASMGSSPSRGNGSNASAALVLAPHSGTEGGIRIHAGGHVAICTDRASTVYYTPSTLPEFHNATSGFGWEAWSNGTANLWVSGLIVCSSIATVSDERAKKEISPIKTALSTINKMNPIRYQFKDETDGVGIYAGFVAQDLEKVLPEVIRTFEDDEFEGGKKTVHYESLIAHLTRGIQEQQTIIEDLETRLQRLEDKL